MFFINETETDSCSNKDMSISPEIDSLNKTPSTDIEPQKQSHSQFGYIFVFTNKSSNKAKDLNPSTIIGLDELIFSLLNHQMIVQLICQLLTGKSSTILTNGFFPDGASLTLVEHFHLTVNFFLQYRRNFKIAYTFR